MKKRNVMERLTSVVLLVCMIFSISWGSTVFAENDAAVLDDLSYPTNEKEVVSLSEDMSEDKLSVEELEKLVEDTEDFSSLTIVEQAQISDEYLVNDAVMTECEDAGYSLSESIELAKIFQNIKISPEQFEVMVKSFGDRGMALEQARIYANYRYTHSSLKMGEDTECINYLISGINAGDILKAKAMSVLVGANISDSALFYADASEYGTDEIADIVLMFNTKRAVVDAYMSQNNLSAEQFTQEVMANLSGILKDAGDYPSTLSDDEEYYYDPALYPMAPFEFKRNGTEVINDQTGGVGYQETDAVIRGKNGLDLTIGIRYNTDSSSFADMFVDMYGIGVETAHNGLAKKEMYSPLNLFAAGWEFASSYIHYYYASYDDFYTSFVGSDGSVRGIRASDIESSSREEVRLYNGKIDVYDVRLYKDSSYTDNGVTSLFCAKYKDGKKEYFDEQGKLMKTENRYGDKIIYRYYTNGSEVSNFKQHYNKVEITDTLNQITTIEKTAVQTEYDDDGNELNIQPMTVTLPDGSTITYRIRGTKHPVNTPTKYIAQLLESKTNQEGMTTSFEYIEDDVSRFSFISGFEENDVEYGRNIYYIMTAISHPTGLRTEYTYEKAEGSLCSLANTWDRYHIVERVDKDGTNEYNKETYTYSDDFSRSTTDTTMTAANSDGLITETTYTRCTTGGDRSRAKSSERVYYMNGSTEVNVSKTEYKDYYERTYPKTITQYVYNQNGTQTLTTTEKYEYDEYGDCVKYWSPYANGDTTNTEHLTTNTYDTEYHYLTQSIYKKDADTTVKEVYTPTEDHKNIIRKETYINNALTARCDYSYDENCAFPNAQMVYRSTDLGDSVTITFEYLNNTFKTKETTNAKSINYTYDIYGNILTQTNANGNTTLYTYDRLGRQTEVAYPDGTSKQLTYLLQNTSGNTINRVTETAQNGAVTQYNYDKLGKVSNVKDLTLGIVKETHEYDSMGRIQRITLPDGAYVTYTYDIMGRTTAQSVYNLGNTLIQQQSFVYEDAYDANTSKVTTVMGTGANVVKSAVYTDKYGNKVREDIGDTGKLTESRCYTYDYTGETSSEIFRTSESGSDMVRTSTRLAADANDGTIITVKDYYNNEIKTYRNMSGQEYDVIDGNGNHTLYTYDANGRVATKTATIDGGLSVTQYTYDNNGNIICESITDNKAGEATTVRSTYTAYDNMDRPVRIWGDEGGETRYTYDNLGNVLTMTTGITETEPQGKTISYEYDARGRLIKTTDAMGYTEQNSYDNRDNLIRVVDKNGSITQNTYDAAGNLVSNKVTKGNQSDTITYTYSNGGQLSSMSNGASTISYTYNAKGQQTAEKITGISPAQKSYTYDADGNLSNISISNGQSVYDLSYTYNYIGQLINVRDNLTSKDIASYTYDSVGNISTKTLANGVTTSYTYNSANALSSLTNKKGNTVLSSYAYTYYLDGNRQGVTDNNGRVQSYTYDKLGQLKSETDTQNGVSRVTNYTYDGSGNRITMSVSGSEQSTVEYTYDANNRLTRTSKTDNMSVTEDKYYYDKNGNLITKTSSGYTDDNGEREELSLKQYPLGISEDTDGALVISYSYTLRNMLSKVETDIGLRAEYTYDASGARAKKTVNGASTSYIWNGSDMVYEQGADTVYYSYGNGIISMTNTDGEYYHIKNGHGDVTQLTDSTGTVTEDYTYDAFGNQLTDTTANNPFRYCGEYFDSETGFIYLRNRYYDTTTGRFITEDPVKDGLNWYVYCGNNPVMFVDPLGLLRAPGFNVQGVWSDNPDRDDYGEYSKVYIALCRLTEAYKVFPEYHSVISELANEVRWIGNEWGSSKIDEDVAEILEVKQAQSLNTVEQVLAAAYKKEALTIQVSRKVSDLLTMVLYNEEGNGTNEANAFKHIYWSAYATSEIGGTYVKLFTNAHEFGWYDENLNNSEAMKMDLHNNQRGRYLGSLDSPKDLLTIVLNDIGNGNAAILVNGKSVLNGR